jgi:nitroreductase
MKFYDVIKQRRSIRAYRDKTIPTDALERIGEAINLAPSACNLQPWKFLIVENKEFREKICKVYPQPWLAQAPAIAVAFGNNETCWKRLEGDPIAAMDIGIAMEHLMLAAAAEGLGSCWICAYNVAAMNEALQVTAPWTTMAISPLGYPAAEPAPLHRKLLREVFEVMK